MIILYTSNVYVLVSKKTKNKNLNKDYQDVIFVEYNVVYNLSYIIFYNYLKLTPNKFLLFLYLITELI